MSGTEAQELELIYELSRAHSLAKVPGKNNWVEHADDNGLPDYIGRIAKAVERSGKSTSAAIAIAVSRVKKWAAGGDGVDADTKAKAAKALAQWEALKAKSGGKKVAMTNSAGQLVQVMSPVEVLSLSMAYSLDGVRKQFDDHVRALRHARRQATGEYDDSPMSYMWAKEVWTDKIIARGDHGEGAALYRIPYTVDKAGRAKFGSATEVQVKYVTVKDLAESEGDIALSASNVEDLLAWSDRISQAEATKVARAITEKLSK